MEIKNIEFAYGRQKVLNDISFKLREGKITTVIGANGCGKSTLFNIMTKNLKPQRGKVLLNGEDIQNLSLKSFARQVAIVHQYNTAPGDLTVEKLVSYGRTAHGGFNRNYEEDQKYIKFAMDITGVCEFSKKQISALSGGQKQRVWIAVALAQNTKILLLDEPTTYLDIRYQIEILRLIKKLNTEYKMTVVMVLHDINQSIAYSDYILAMKEGKILSEGSPDEVINEKLIKEVYGIELKVENSEKGKFVMTI